MEMNKTNMIEVIAEQYNMTKKDARAALEIVMEAIVNEIKAGNDVALPGFGKLKVVEKGERNGINPQTMEIVTYEAHKVVKYVPAKSIKEAVREL